MYQDTIIITLSLSREFADQLVGETEQAALVQGVHTLIPVTVLQLASLVSAKITGDGWITVDSDPQGCRS